MGIHFRSGEWGRNSCGSVITTVVGGRSLYARVESFLHVRGEECPGYAIVKWFGEPSYPFGIPLVVRVSDDGSDIENAYGNVIKITSIDPSRVMIDPEGEGFYYMMRDSGYDTVPE